MESGHHEADAPETYGGAEDDVHEEILGGVVYGGREEETENEEEEAAGEEEETLRVHALSLPHLMKERTHQRRLMLFQFCIRLDFYRFNLAQLKS